MWEKRAVMPKYEQDIPCFARISTLRLQRLAEYLFISDISVRRVKRKLNIWRQSILLIWLTITPHLVLCPAHTQHAQNHDGCYIVAVLVVYTCKSKVWQFFRKSGDKTVTCEVCQANLAYHGGTSSMKEHLKWKHPTEDPPKESKRPACKQV